MYMDPLMSEENSKIDRLIVNFLSGEASSEEQAQLQSWIESDDEHCEYFCRMRDAWQSSAQAGRLPLQRIEKALDKVTERISMTSISEKRRQLQKAQKPIWPRRQLKYAAAAALLMILSGSVTMYFANRRFDRQSCEIIYQANYGSRAYVVLPDSSSVWLNSGSKLVFRSDYNFRERDVKLTGEAYFDVQTNPDKPFIVKAGNLQIKATGTAFNVKAYPEDNQITTTLVKGLVTIEGVDDQQRAFVIKMKPDQSISYRTSSLKKEPESVETRTDNAAVNNLNDIHRQEPIPLPTILHGKTEKHISWKEDRWIIDNENFGNLAIELERRYDVSIRFTSEELKEYNFTGIIENETLEQIFNIFTYSIPLKYSIDKGVVTLTVDKQLEKRYKKAWKTNQ